MMKIRVIPTAYAWRVWLDSIQIVKGKYIMFFLAAFITLLGGSLPHLIPFVGPAISGFLMSYLFGGYLLLIEKYDREKVFDFNILFQPFSDILIFKKIFPLAITISFFFGLIFLTLMSLESNAIGETEKFFGILLVALMQIFFKIFAYFAIPLRVLRNTSVLSSFSLSLQAFLKNIHIFMIYSLVGFLILLLSIPTAFLLLLYLLPQYFTHTYLFYKKLIEEAPIIEEIEKEKTPIIDDRS